MCVTIELDYKEVLARRMHFDKDIKFCVNESLEECAIRFCLITKSGLWPSGGINGRKSGKPCH